MPDQVSYYNLFGESNEQSILNCPEPEFWTTDYAERGRIYKEMKERVVAQKQLFHTYFKTDKPVLDIGCGFGRQAILLAKEGYVVTGTDTSGTFISIANKLFKKFGYQGEFIQTDLLDDDIIKDKFSQIIILDVLEHIPPTLRKIFITKIYDRSTPALILIISLPKVKDRLTSRFNNRIRKTITQHIKYFFSKEEHPYPIPERNDLIKLMIEKFSLLRLETTKDTDFYVYQRK